MMRSRSAISQASAIGCVPTRPTTTSSGPCRLWGGGVGQTMRCDCTATCGPSTASEGRRGAQRGGEEGGEGEERGHRGRKKGYRIS